MLLAAARFHYVLHISVVTRRLHAEITDKPAKPIVDPKRSMTSFARIGGL
jgi:hypothetical protein